MRNPKVSVIMSVYKEPIEWLHESIDSILNQTFKDFEFIIICDNPEYKEGKRLLEEYQKKDKRIIIICNEQNIGLTKSLNKGLAIAKGEYIARMDADDISMPERFEKQCSFMDTNSNVIVLGTNITFIGDYSRFESSYWIKFTNEEAKAQLRINSCFAHPTVFIRKSILDDNHIMYDEEYRQAQDYRMWEIIEDYGDFANLQETLLKYRVSAVQVSRKHNSNTNKNASSIRKRLISKVLDRIDVNEKDYYCTDIINARNSVSRCVGKIAQPYLWCLQKSLYYSTNNRKCLVFIRSCFNGDFFRMNFYEKLKFLKIIVGYAPALSL